MFLSILQWTASLKILISVFLILVVSSDACSNISAQDRFFFLIKNVWPQEGAPCQQFTCHERSKCRIGVLRKKKKKKNRSAFLCWRLKQEWISLS